MASMPACFPEQLWRSRLPSTGPHSSSSSDAHARASNAFTASSCSVRAPCEAQAMAISSSARSAHSRTSRSACSGFAAERTNVTRFESPWASTTSPSRTLTACTRWRDSTTPPLSTATLSGSTEECLPEFPEIESLRRSLDAPVQVSPIERAGPAHVATLKTFDPPLEALHGRRFAGAERRGKNILLPTDDDELVLHVHLMSAGRLRYLANGEKLPKAPAFKLTFENGGVLVLTEGGPKKRARVGVYRPE